MEDENLKMDEDWIFMGMFALKEKLVGKLLSVSIIFLWDILEGMNSDKRLEGKSCLSRKEQKFPL